MLINEIVIKENKPLTEKLTFDPNDIKDVTFKGTKYIWDKNVRQFRVDKTNNFIAKNDSLHRKLLKAPENKPALGKFKKPGLIRRGIDKMGMSGVRTPYKKPAKSGIARGILGTTGNIVGQAMDNIANAVAGGIQNFRKGYQDQKKKNQADKDAPENNLNTFNTVFNKKWRVGDIDTRPFMRNPEDGNSDVRHKNPNYNKTIGKDHFKVDWEMFMKAPEKFGGDPANAFKKDKSGKKILTKPNYYAYGDNDKLIKNVDRDPNMRDKNNPADDMRNLKILVQRGALTKDEANEIIDIASKGGMQLNKAYGVWQKEKDPSAVRRRTVTRRDDKPTPA